MDWEFLTGSTETGGAPITSYELQMDDGLGGNFVEKVGFSAAYTLNSILITSNIASGRTYRCQYRAQNIHGWGDFSDVTEILAATIPSVPVGEPETSIDIAETRVKLQWQAPSNLGGDGVPLTAYRVEILLADGISF